MKFYKQLTSACCLFAYFLLMELTGSAVGLKILVMPVNTPSHVHKFARLGLDLAHLGHVVRLIVPSNSRIPYFARDVTNATFTLTTYSVENPLPFLNTPYASEMISKIGMTKSLLWKTKYLADLMATGTPVMERDCENMFEDRALMKELRSEGYDFAIVDVLVPYCYLALPYSMGIPYAGLSIYFMPLLYRIPRLPSFASFTGFSDRMSFSERLTTFLLQVAGHAASWNLSPTTRYVETYAPSRPPLDGVALLRGMSLWFHMEDDYIGFPMPSMPNTALVGDVMSGRPGLALATEFDNFLSAYRNGAVLVSFGSFHDYLPEILTNRLCDAFRKLGDDGIGVVWRITGADLCSKASNVLTAAWIPQNDLLADRRVKVFVGHGGLNGIQEAIYHRKPMIVIPFVVDQPTNAAVVESKGLGKRIEAADLTADDLYADIHELLKNTSFRDNLELASRIIGDRRNTPAERASFLIQHVVKYGDKHLRTGAVELSLFQFLMVDIFLTISAVFLGIGLLAAAACCCLYRACCKRYLSTQGHKNKHD